MNSSLAIVAASTFAALWIIGRVTENFGPAPLGPGATLLAVGFSAGCAGACTMLSSHRMDSLSDVAVVAAVLGAASLIALAEKKLDIAGRNRQHAGVPVR